jgi:hypothetical protein
MRERGVLFTTILSLGGTVQFILVFLFYKYVCRVSYFSMRFFKVVFLSFIQGSEFGFEGRLSFLMCASSASTHRPVGDMLPPSASMSPSVRQDLSLSLHFYGCLPGHTPSLIIYVTVSIALCHGHTVHYVPLHADSDAMFPLT